MRKNYESPDVDIIQFETENVITTSFGGMTDGGGGTGGSTQF